MPKRQDLKKILIIGSGPIVISQGSEFDYSGVQACKALRSAGYYVVLVNSNPATIMTDPALADATYIEPIDYQTVAEIIAKERPQALLPTMGGQTALNCALDLCNNGLLEQYNVELIGATKDAIEKAEDREKFQAVVASLGLEAPYSYIANNINEAKAIQTKLGFPVIVRGSYVLGGSGSGVAYNSQDFLKICQQCFKFSAKISIEEYLYGYKEFELEVVRDKKDNCIVVCSIENLDPMGIHTGDSITIAPAQTLTDREYQKMRNMAIAILRAIGVDTGGANVQFALNPKDGRILVIEMNPRVSRSSALASKATGFPIAKIAALLAVGYTLDELQNDMVVGGLPASFEPTLDYVVTKIPRFDFNKFPNAKIELTTQMKAVGEVMAIGTTFGASLQKALMSLELDLSGLDPKTSDIVEIEHFLKTPTPLRILYIADAYRIGLSTDYINKLTYIDPWFLEQIEKLVLLEQSLKEPDPQVLKIYKEQGFSDQRLASLLHIDALEVHKKRHKLSFRRIDGVAAEFPAKTAYLYSSYEDVCEATPSANKKVIVLGSGPNRIGQGLEFDYCCVHAVLALKDAGFEAIMINCNPETVSTDCDIADKLYFEPLTLETVLEIVYTEKPLGVVVQFGGQTPLNLVAGLQQAGVRILGTSPESINITEDRGHFAKLIDSLGLQKPLSIAAKSIQEGIDAANKLGYPLLVRPSYVLGGFAMQVLNSESELIKYFTNINSGNYKVLPILLEHFIEDAIEVDIDAVVDINGEVFVAGIMEHIEKAGIHSGDSSCSLPPYSLDIDIQQELCLQVKRLANSLSVVGLINVQFAIKNNYIYVLEVNLRASRTMPFVSKSIGISITKSAIFCILGESLSSQKISKNCINKYFFVKCPVFSSAKFPEVVHVLGPEMKSTGEVMGIATSFIKAYGKAVRAMGIDEGKSVVDSIYKLQLLKEF